MELHPEVFLRVPLMEQYFNFLRVSGLVSFHLTILFKVRVIAQRAHERSTCGLALKHITREAMTECTSIHLLRSLTRVCSFLRERDLRKPSRQKSWEVRAYSERHVCVWFFVALSTI